MEEVKCMAEHIAASQEQLNKWGGVFSSLPAFDLTPARTAFIIVDMQYLDAHRDYGMGAAAKGQGTEVKYEYYFSRIEQVVIPNIQKMQQICRQHGIEVIFLRIASLVKDCRDVSAVHKRLKLFAPAGSPEAEILEGIKPTENEIVITKGCSGAFNGSNLDQILANIGIKNLIFGGVVTNYCVETSVRDAGDRDYNVILLDDGCAALTPEQHRLALEVLDDCYCKVMTTDEAAALIEALAATHAETPLATAR
jgi:nicotinamidase-related amidase